MIVSTITARRELSVPGDTLIAPRGALIVRRATVIQLFAESIVLWPKRNTHESDAIRHLGGASATSPSTVATGMLTIARAPARIVTWPGNYRRNDGRHCHPAWSKHTGTENRRISRWYR